MKPKILMMGILDPEQPLLKHLKNIGKEKFSKEYIFFAFSHDDLIWAEAHFVDFQYISRLDTYNIELGGGNGFHKGNIPHNKNKKGIYLHSNETKSKMSASHLGKPKSKESSIKSGLSRRGTKRTPEQIKTLSDAHKGYIWSEQSKKKLSETRRGMSFSESHRHSISVTALNRPRCSCLFCHKELPINNLQYHLSYNLKCLTIQQLRR